MAIACVFGTGAVCLVLASSGAGGVAYGQAVSPPRTITIEVDARAPSHPFSHFWEQMFALGRAILSLRADYQRDLRSVKVSRIFSMFVFTMIFDDDIGVCTEKIRTATLSTIFLTSIRFTIASWRMGVRPFVELSFMLQQALALPAVSQSFWYHLDRFPTEGLGPMWRPMALSSRSTWSSATGLTRFRGGTLALERADHRLLGR